MSTYSSTGQQITNTDDLSQYFTDGSVIGFNSGVTSAQVQPVTTNSIANTYQPNTVSFWGKTFNSGGTGSYANISDGAGGTIGIDQSAYNSIQQGNANLPANQQTQATITPKQYGMSQGVANAIGIGQLGLGIASYFDTRKANKANLELAKKDYQLSADKWNDLKSFRSNLGKQFS